MRSAKIGCQSKQKALTQLPASACAVICKSIVDGSMLMSVVQQVSGQLFGWDLTFASCHQPPVRMAATSEQNNAEADSSSVRTFVNPGQIM